MQSIPDLNVFAKKCHEASKAKGWLDDERSIEDYTMLMVSELVEALEDLRNGRGLTEVYYEGAKPCGIPIELADFVIRVGQFCGTYELDLMAGVEDHGSFKSVSELTTALKIASLSTLSVFSIATRNLSAQAAGNLGHALSTIVGFCEGHGIDLWRYVDEKMAYNETRPHKHGGKKL